jgi:gliding motility-associated-like protein
VVLTSGLQPAAYAGTDGANHLTFNYTVQAGDLDDDGITPDPNVLLDAANTIKDAAGNTANPALNGLSTNIVKVDAVAPAIVSVDVPSPGYYTTSQSLQFQVHFSEAVGISGTPVLSFVLGTTTKHATLASSNNKDFYFLYVVKAGDEDLDGITVNGLSTNGTIRDGVNNDADLTLHNVGNTSGVLVYTVMPTVTVSQPVDLHGPWTVTFTFSEKVTGFEVSDILVTNATMSNLQTPDNITYTALLTPVADGPVSISVPQNVAVNVAGIYNTPSSTISYWYDGTRPAIVSVDVPADKYYTTGAVLEFKVHYSEAVNVNTLNGAPSLPLTIGSSAVQAAYADGGGSAELLFRYTVKSGDMDLDGITPSAALLLNGGIMSDASGNNAQLTLNGVPNTSQVRINTRHPAVQLTSAAPARINAPFEATVTFSEEVSGFTAADVTAANATISAPQTSDNITYTVTVTPVADGAVSLGIPADVAANTGGNGNTASGTLTRTYDHTAPVIATQTFNVNNNAAAGALAGKLTAMDASGVIQDWAIVSDGSGGAFAIDASGNITVKDPVILDSKAGTTVTVTVTVTDGLNISTATPVTIGVILAYVNKTPTLATIADESICPGTDAHDIQLTGASAVEPGQTYAITAVSDQPYFDVLNVSAANVLTYRLKSGVSSGVAAITVTIQDNGGTANGAVDQFSQTFTITVNSLPTVTISSDKGASISKGDVVRLTAAGGSTYAWTNADGIVSGQRTSTLEVRPMTNTTYEVTATTAAGCSSTATFDIAVAADFKVDATNVLTPNGDGRNDKWLIRNLDSYPDNEVSIFDRTGRMVYHRLNYSNDWDGTINGRPLAEGTYYYILKITGTSRIAKGYINIIRDQQ